ncbi:MAG TPA: hypothetical protein VM661_04415 [Candidatus Sulfotelmatobacter sp.]|nr:hypothetical protein [Candidatus Sulfotelmatobacter sp.]
MRKPFTLSASLAASAAAGLLLLGGCSGPLTYSPGSRSVQISALYGYGAADRDLKLEVQGNAFAGQMSGTDFAHKVEAALQSPIMRPATHLTLAPNDTAKSNYRVVFLFNPANVMGGQNLCDGRADQQPAPAGEVRAVAAFCVAGRAVTEITGRTQVVGPNDERFLQLMAIMKNELFREDERPNSNSMDFHT